MYFTKKQSIEMRQNFMYTIGTNLRAFTIYKIISSFLFKAINVKKKR